MRSEFKTVLMKMYLQIDVVIGGAVRRCLLGRNSDDHCENDRSGEEHDPPCLFLKTP